MAFPFGQYLEALGMGKTLISPGRPRMEVLF